MHEGDGFSAKTLGESLFQFQNDWSGHGSGRPILSFEKCPKIAPTPIPFQNFHFNLFQPV